MKKISVVVVIIMLALSLSVGVAVVCDVFTPEKPVVYVEFSTSRVDGYTTIYTPKDYDLKILQLTDPQQKYPVNDYEYIGGSNEGTFVFIERLVKATDPDLVVITGDIVMSQMMNNYSYFLEYGEFFEELGVYWAFTFGNHDCEGSYVYETNNHEDLFGQRTKETIVKAMRAFPHCLIVKGDAEKGGGVGNYFINVREQETEEIKYTLCMMDCVYEPQEDEYHREKTPEQIAWYEKHINNISDLKYGENRKSDEVVKSMVFTHVPVPEIFDAFESAWNNGNSNENYCYGDWVEGSNSNAQYNSCQFFEKCKELGSTTAMFSGHWHSNGFDVIYDGIHLVFGQHSGVSHYYRVDIIRGQYNTYDMRDIFAYGDERGGTMITIDTEDESFEINQILARDTIKYDDLAIDYEELYLTLVDYGDDVIR